MGLGLASTLNILQAHKAGVEVQSGKNTGTTFILSFKPSAEIPITNKTLKQMTE
jgi:signal transduction histidine kinase